MKAAFSVAILVPAHNEAAVIADTCRSLLRLSSANHLYVIDDGSSDKTSQIARKFTRHVLVTKNQGKAAAINCGLEKYNLPKRYNFIFFMDADTQPNADFLERAMIHFKKDKHKQVVCVVGRVKSRSVNWVTQYRQWEYHISHLIHKKAQENMQCILVVPGCATVYRSKVFEKLRFPEGTLTEDMDFTFMMHRSGLSNIIFEDRALVYTQDPNTVTALVKQLRRWYSGFWQVVRKYDIPWGGQILDIEVTILALEGLYNGLAVVLFIISFIPLTLFGNLSAFRIPFLLDLFIFFIPTLIWSAGADHDWSRLWYIPQFYFLRFLSSLIFLRSFFDGYLQPERTYVWNTSRYLFVKRKH